MTKKLSDHFDELVATISALRDPQTGCPWDLEQTHQSLVKYLHEETEEVVEEIARLETQEQNYDSLAEELGDVLLQILLHSQIASESNNFTIDDVVVNLNDKLKRRHPHVFGDSDVRTIEDVEKQWKKIKEEEKKSKDKNV